MLVRPFTRNIQCLIIKKKPNSLILLNTDSNNKYYKHDVIDLCPTCMGKVMDILNPKEDQVDQIRDEKRESKERLLTIVNAVLAIAQRTHALDSDVHAELYNIQDDLEREIEKERRDDQT